MTLTTIIIDTKMADFPVPLIFTPKAVLGEKVS